MKLPFRNDFPPRNDVVFSIMFGDMTLFSVLLKCVTGHELKTKEIISQACVLPDNVEHNYIRFDTFAKDENGTIYSIDLQNTYSETLIKNRTIYYACRAVAGQTVNKGNYDQLNKVVISFIMTCKKNALPTEVIRLYNQNHEIYSDLFTLYNVYTPAVNQSEKANRELKIFSEFFSVKNEEQMGNFIDRYAEDLLGKRLIVLYSQVIGRKDLNIIQEGEYFDMKISEQDIIEAKMEARAAGLSEGRAEGILSTLIGLVKKGIITLAQAAEEANMTVSEFESKAGLKA